MAAAEVLGTKALFPEVNDLNINFVAGPAELNINPVDEDETVTPLSVTVPGKRIALWTFN